MDEHPECSVSPPSHPLLTLLFALLVHCRSSAFQVSAPITTGARERTLRSHGQTRPYLSILRSNSPASQALMFRQYQLCSDRPNSRAFALAASSAEMA